MKIYIPSKDSRKYLSWQRQEATAQKTLNILDQGWERDGDTKGRRHFDKIEELFWHTAKWRK